MPAPAAVLDDLRAQLARIEQGNASISVSPLSLGFSLDRHLPGAGLARGALHEVQAADVGAGLAFCALLMMRTRGAVLWISPQPEPVWAPGLQALGLDVGRLILARYRTPADGLWTMEEALRCPALGGAVLRLDQLDMTASRRLQLAVEGSERIGLLLRTETAGQGPTAATTRWRTASLPDPAAGPRWQLDLLRCRGGRPGSWVVELQGGEIRAVPAHRMRSA